MNERKIQLDDKIGIIAGRDVLPQQIVAELISRNIKPYMVAFNDVTHVESTKDAETLWARMGNTGRIINFFKDNGVRQIVLAGGVKRPSYASLIPDALGIKLINRIRQLSESGDNSLFDVIIEFLEEQGLQVLGVDDVVTELVAHKGPMGKHAPVRKFLKDIELGSRIASEIGRLDIGQSVIVQNGLILGAEGLDGTDALIERCRTLQIDNHGAILVKMKKPKQDRRIDLPSIGINTIEKIHECGLKGVAIQAGNSLIINKTETIKRANELGVFIYGV